MPNVKRINKNTIKANFRKGIPFTGYMAGDNTNSYHINNGWHCGYLVKDVPTLEELNKLENNFKFYLEPELGRRVVYWVEIG